MTKKRKPRTDPELGWWYRILDQSVREWGGDNDPIPVNPFIDGQGRFRVAIGPNDLLPGAAEAWMETFPVPPDLPRNFDELATWLGRSGLAADNRTTLDAFLPTWVHVPKQHLMMLPTFDDLVLDSTVRERFLPKQRHENHFFKIFIDHLRGPLLQQTLLIRCSDAEEAALRDDPEGRLMSALRDAAHSVVGNISEWFEPKYLTIAGGIATSEDVYCLSFLDKSPYRYYTKAEIARVGLWPDRPEEMRLGCDCGGTLRSPCAHLAIALERCIETLMNPEHPGHDALVDRVAHPNPISALDVLKRTAPADGETGLGNIETSDNARIAWCLSMRNNEWRAEPLIQQRAKRGGWTKGRKVALTSWAFKHDTAHTPADDLVENALETRSSITWLRALSAHPAVYVNDGSTAPVSVTETTVGLAITEDEGALRLGFRFGGRRCSVQQMHTWLDTEQRVSTRYDEGTGRFFFAPVSREAVDLVVSLLQTPTRIPKQRLYELTELLSRRHDGLPVHIDKSLRRDDIKPNLTPVLRMTPEGESSLSVSVGFHLFSDELWTAPGEGAAYLIRGIKGVPAGLHRNLHEERRIAQQVLIGIDITELTPVGDWSFLATDLDAVVMLLSAIRTLETPHTVSGRWIAPLGGFPTSTPGTPVSPSPRTRDICSSSDSMSRSTIPR